MPFEPLGTDEQYEGPPLRQPENFEKTLTKGCGVVLLGSLAVFFLILWPFLIFPEYTFAGLGQIAVFGGLPAMAVGVVMVRMFGIPGVSAFGGGAMAGGMFMWLRFQQSMLREYSVEGPKPDFGPAVAMMIPFAWVILCAVVIAIFYPRGNEPEPQ